LIASVTGLIVPIAAGAELSAPQARLTVLALAAAAYLLERRDA
jgi:hypothetical protein